MHRAHLWPWDEMPYQTGGLLFEFMDLEMIEHTMNFGVLRKNDKHFALKEGIGTETSMQGKSGKMHESASYD